MIFKHPFCRKTKKIERGTLWWKRISKKVALRRKKFERGDPLVSPDNVCYAEKKKNLFGLVPWANG